MKDKISRNPYHANVTEQARPLREVKSRTRMSVVTGLVALFGFGKWYLPVIFGTGDSYTFGYLGEEWTIVFPLGVVCALFHYRSSFLQPLNYFTFAYIVHFPLSFNKFSFVYWALGISSVLVMYLGVAIGIGCNRLFTLKK